MLEVKLKVDRMKQLICSLVIAISLVAECSAETVDVKYRGQLDLKPFACTTIERSSFIRRVCYDSANAYMVVSLDGTYYHYCDIDEGTVNSFLAAPSMGRFFDASIKGHFACTTGHVPAY
jgi:hypothetical protein